MKQQVKEEWIINNLNIFGLKQDIKLSLSSIQYEIVNQLKNRLINSISDYLDAEIDITKEIKLTNSLTIQKIFSEFLGFENIKIFEQNSFNCYLILSYLQLSLLKEYYSESHKNILTFSEYEKQYDGLLNVFITSNIDTDEQDFIKAELNLCDNLIKELNKPIYNIISPFNEILDSPCDFKKNLANSIDKRKKFLEQKANETIPKIKALFQFVEYLYSNIEKFNQYNDLIKELELLKAEKNKLNPENNYRDKLRYDELQPELESKFKLLQDNTANLIKAKAIELNVCDFDNESDYSFNGIDAEIYLLKKNFSNKDLPLIFKHKSQYLKYRSQTHKTFLSLQFFFEDLDEITKSLFDYFKDTKQNEFEAFETKAIEVNSIAEAIKGFNQEGHTKFTLPTGALFNAPQSQQIQNDILPPQLISIDESRTKKVIIETIANIDKKGWQYAFISEQDYNLFTDLLTNFFEYKSYTLPEKTIQLKRTCKTKLAKALGEIHKELSNENKLTTDTNYFKLIRVLNHFENETEGDLYKALTR